MKPKRVIFANEDLQSKFYDMSDKDPLKKALIRAIEHLKENSYAGRNVKKKLIPKEFIQKYNLKNIWIYNLPDAWRVIYSLTTGGELEVISVVLDWMNHQDYERLFKF